MVKYKEYKDDGCEVSLTCFECPLPECQYSSTVRACGSKKVRNDKVRQEYSGGATFADLASKCKLSTRMIYRIVKGK